MSVIWIEQVTAVVPRDPAVGVGEAVSKRTRSERSGLGQLSSARWSSLTQGRYARPVTDACRDRRGSCRSTVAIEDGSQWAAASYGATPCTCHHHASGRNPSEWAMRWLARLSVLVL